MNYRSKRNFKKLFDMMLNENSLKFDEQFKIFEELKALENNETDSMPVGKVSNELSNFFLEYEKQERNLEQDIYLKVEELKIEFIRMLEDSFEERKRQIKNMKNLIWEKVYEELNLDPHERYSIDIDSRTVSQIIDINDKNNQANIS